MSNPLGWPSIFNLKDDAEVKEAIDLLVRFNKVYKKIISDSGKLKNTYTKNIRSIVQETQKLEKQVKAMKPSTDAGREALVQMSSKADVLTASYGELKGKICLLYTSDAADE